MKKILFTLLCVVMFSRGWGQLIRFDAPWNIAPKSAVNFTIHGIDNVPDLYGDINDPQLVIFFAGNQFMCVDSLLAVFKVLHPEVQRIFAETLPPGVLAKQIKGGSLTIGNLRLTLKPDVFTAGTGMIASMMPYLRDTGSYAHNRLAIMVKKGNPKHIRALKDLARSDVRVCVPVPAWGGIGGQVAKALRKAGGLALEAAVVNTKIKEGTAFPSGIHHREAPLYILNDICDAGLVWYSETHYQQMVGNPIGVVEIPEGENIVATYMVGILKNAPHPKAAEAFRDFLMSSRASAIYRFYGFL